MVVCMWGSGIAVVAVMCKPHRCPHIAMTGNVCVYCPGGPDSDFEYSTQVGQRRHCWHGFRWADVACAWCLRPTRGTSRQACEPSEHGTTRTRRREDGSTSSRG